MFHANDPDHRTSEGIDSIHQSGYSNEGGIHQYLVDYDLLYNASLSLSLSLVFILFFVIVAQGTTEAKWVPPRVKNELLSRTDDFFGEVTRRKTSTNNSLSQQSSHTATKKQIETEVLHHSFKVSSSRQHPASIVVPQHRFPSKIIILHATRIVWLGEWKCEK